MLLFAVGLVAALPGLAGEVPAPFTPLEVRSFEGGVDVQPWGRRYRFERGPLPVSILSQGVEILAAAPRWTVDAGDGPTPLSWSEATVEEADGRAVELRSSAPLGGRTVRARTRIEYDGMVRVDVEIAGGAEEDALRLRAFDYAIPLRPEIARWYNHHVAYDYNRLTIDKNALVNSAGRFPEATRRFDYTPTFSIGNHEVGVEWWSDENIDWKTPREPIVLEPAESEAVLRVAPVSAPLPAAGSWRHRFALFPAPMRPAPPRWRSNRFISPSAVRQFEREGFEYYWVAFPGQMQARYHGLPEAAQNAEQRALRQRLESQGVRYIPYGKLMASPSYHPETLAHKDTWPANRQLFTVPSGSEAAMMRARNGWKTGEPYSYNVCAAHTDYFDWMLEENLKALRQEQLDGIYFDFGSLSSLCETDPRLEGRKDAQAWHYFELRDFYKRLYEAVQASRPDALITIHTNGQPRALTAWVDYNFVGEALNAVFRNGRSWKQVAARPELYDSDYFALSPDFLLAQTLPPVGGAISVLPQLHKARLEMDEETLRSNQRGFLAQVLVNDTHFWFANADHAALVETIAALDRFGSLDDARVEPWWQPPATLQHDGGPLRVTVYRRDGSALAIVANWTDTPRSGTFVLRPEDRAAGLDTWRDLEAKPSRVRRIPDYGFAVTVPAHDFQLLMIE